MPLCRTRPHENRSATGSCMHARHSRPDPDRVSTLFGRERGIFRATQRRSRRNEAAIGELVDEGCGDRCAGNPRGPERTNACTHAGWRTSAIGRPSLSGGSLRATLVNQGSYPMPLDSTSRDPDRAPRFVSALRLPNVSTLWGGTGPTDHTGGDNSPDGVDSNPCDFSLASTGGRIAPGAGGRPPVCRRWPPGLP